MKNPISYDSSVSSRDGYTPGPTSAMKWFLSLVAVSAFNSREYILQHLLMTGSETKKS